MVLEFRFLKIQITKVNLGILVYKQLAHDGISRSLHSLCIFKENLYIAFPAFQECFPDSYNFYFNGQRNTGEKVFVQAEVKS